LSFSSQIPRPEGLFPAAGAGMRRALRIFSMAGLEPQSLIRGACFKIELPSESASDFSGEFTRRTNLAAEQGTHVDSE
jgi:hypothetical protein